jgi:hypothetical protein
LGDKAFSSKAIRRNLRRRGITATIPELADQIKHRDVAPLHDLQDKL